MPPKAEIIDLVEDDLDEQYKSISVPDDIEEIEAMPVAGPSRKRDLKSASEEKPDKFGEKFDEEQAIRGKVAKLDVEVRLYRSTTADDRSKAFRVRWPICRLFKPNSGVSARSYNCDWTHPPAQKLSNLGTQPPPQPDPALESNS